MKAHHQTPPARAACRRAQAAKRDRYVTAAGGKPGLDALRDRDPESFEGEAAPQSFQRRALRLQR